MIVPFILICSVWQLRAAVGTITDLTELELDGNDHLKSHWILYKGGACEKKFMTAWNADRDNALTELSTMSDSLAKAFAKNPSDGCVAVWLESGTSKDYLQYPIASRVYDDSLDMVEWIRTCQDVEMGIISYLNKPAVLYWNSPDGRKIKNTVLKRGEKHTFWMNTRLGHSFTVEDTATGVSLYNITAKYNSFYPLGDAGTFVQEIDAHNAINDLFQTEFNRSRNVKRTFTEFGFQKSRLPDDLWSTIHTYYYNNKERMVREEWESRGFAVNWWEKDAFMIGMPWQLKSYWQTRIKDMVAGWIGGKVELESTSIYGIRRYENGARLLSHVDRQPTHAVSMIINVDQSVRKPWLLEIYDHADRLHEVEMAPGDVVYYESARCLHGRMTPLDGDYFVNIFTHYRPVGDPEWFMKPNPPGTPEPMIDITGVEIPTLSPKGHVVRGPNDLYDYWNMVEKPSQSQDFRREL